LSVDVFLQNSQLHVTFSNITVEPSPICPRLNICLEIDQGAINFRQATPPIATQYVNLSNLIAELKMIGANGEEYYVGQLFSNQSSIALYSNSKATLIFNLNLDHFTLAQIEKLRESKDLQLVVHSVFTYTFAFQPFSNDNTGSANLKFNIPKSDWVEKYLPALGFKTVSLIEVPQPIDSVFAETISHVNDAWKQYSVGEYHGVLTDCRKAMESLSDKIKSKGFQKEVAEEGKKIIVPDWDKFLDNEELGEVVATINEISRLTATDAHPGRIICRVDAVFALMNTTATVNLVVRKYEQLQT